MNMHIPDQSDLKYVNNEHSLDHLSDHKHITYRSHDIPGKGTYKCKKCKEQIDLEDGEQLPRCPVCKHNEFSKEK